MGKEKKEVATIKAKIVYDNFVNKYTKKKYELNSIIALTDKRLSEIRQAEEKSGITLIELIEDNTKNANSGDKNVANEGATSINENDGEKSEDDEDENADEKKDAE